jgi:hypothetical protein
MKLRHTPGLALVGWYLLIAPFGGSYAAGPPKCPSGSAPFLDFGEGWTCLPGAHWPSGQDLKQSDCPPGTSFVQMYQDAACLPPPPHCPLGASPYASDVTVDTVTGWRCLPKPDCAAGTEAVLDLQGWQCEPPGGYYDCPVHCPNGSLYVAECCGTCAPANQTFCEHLRGWKWVKDRCELQ